MKTLIAALAAVTAVTAFAAPAAAQSYDRYGDRHDNGRYEQTRPNRGGYNLNERQEQLNRSIARGVRSGALTRREAAQLRDDAHDIARIEARYRQNGLNGWERADLDRRFDRLETRIARQTHDRDYGQGYGHRR